MDHRYPNFARLQGQLSHASNKEASGHKDKIHSLAFNSDGNKIASGSLDKAARVWNTDRLSESDEFKGHTATIDQLVWDPSTHHTFATASTDKTVRIWDIRVKESVHIIETPGENINICWSPNGKTIAVGNKEDIISFIDPRSSTGASIFKSIDNQVEINEIGWNYGGNLFFMTTGHGCIDIIEFSTFKPIYSLPAHSSTCSALAFDPIGRYFATGGGDAMTLLWDIDSLLTAQSYSRLETPIRSIGFSFDGELIASASEDPVIDIAYVQSGNLVHQIECKAALNSLSWHPSLHLIAYATDETGRNSGKINVFGFE